MIFNLIPPMNKCIKILIFLLLIQVYGFSQKNLKYTLVPKVATFNIEFADSSHVVERQYKNNDFTLKQIQELLFFVGQKEIDSVLVFIDYSTSSGSPASNSLAYKRALAIRDYFDLKYSHIPIRKFKIRKNKQGNNIVMYHYRRKFDLKRPKNETISIVDIPEELKKIITPKEEATQESTQDPILTKNQEFEPPIQFAKTGYPFAIKTNILFNAALTPNLSIEIPFLVKYSVEVSATYNAWNQKDNIKWKNMIFITELRYWTLMSMKGHYIGVNANYGFYNIGGLKMPYYADASYYRYEGWMAGAGVSYGYLWNLTKNLSFEANIGVGVNYTSYDKYLHPVCGAFWGSFKNFLVMPSKLGLSIVYHFN